MSDGRRRWRALIVDDHALVLEGIRLMLEQIPNVEVVGEASSGEEAIERQRGIQPNLVFMDLTLPGIDGIAAIRLIKQADAGVHVVALSAREDKDAILGAFRAGASAFLAKSSTIEDLSAALASLEADSVYVSSVLAGRMLQKISAERTVGSLTGTANDVVTPREREVVELLSDGLTARTIASRLGISERTVNAHVANLYRRLGVTNRVDAVREAMRMGLLHTIH